MENWKMEYENGIYGKYEIAKWTNEKMDNQNETIKPIRRDDGTLNSKFKKYVPEGRIL